MSAPDVIPLQAQRWRGAAPEAVEEEVAVEEPLEIRLRGASVGVLMRTPGHDEELACGYVITEGIVEAAAVRYASPCRQVPPEAIGNVIHVMIPDAAAASLAGRAQRSASASGCGVCGRGELETLFAASRPVAPLAAPLPPEVVGAALEALRAAQAGFSRTGGLHAAGLWSLRQGRLVVAREDIGRHNAVDKVIGWAALKRRLPLTDHLLVVSSRAGFEIAQKAVVAGIGALAAVSAPSSLAVATARAGGLILIGFAREGRLTVYAEADRMAWGV